MANKIEKYVCDIFAVIKRDRSEGVSNEKSNSDDSRFVNYHSLVHFRAIGTGKLKNENERNDGRDA